MYLHLGNSVVIRKRDVIGVFDLDNTSQSPRTRDYLAAAERAGRVVNAAGDEIPKSFIIVSGDGGGEQTVYLSQLNSSTLLRRSAGRGLDASFE